MTSNDPSALREEITRLRHALAHLRLTYANLLAATRAAVAAEHDGEPDPIAYLRYELPDHPPRPGADGTASGGDR